MKYLGPDSQNKFFNVDSVTQDVGEEIAMNYLKVQLINPTSQVEDAKVLEIVM